MTRGFITGDDRIDVRPKIGLGTAVIGIVFVAAMVVTSRDRAPAMDNHSVQVRFATTGCVDEVCSVAVTGNQATGDWELWGGGGQHARVARASVDRTGIRAVADTVLGSWQDWTARPAASPRDCLDESWQGAWLELAVTKHGTSPDDSQVQSALICWDDVDLEALAVLRAAWLTAGMPWPVDVYRDGDEAIPLTDGLVPITQS